MARKPQSTGGDEAKSKLTSRRKRSAKTRYGIPLEPATGGNGLPPFLKQPKPGECWGDGGPSILRSRGPEYDGKPDVDAWKPNRNED